MQQDLYYRYGLQLQLLFQHHCHGRSSIRRCSNIYAPCPSPITIEIWGSILDYFFINHTLRPGTLARRSPFRSSRQPAELLSEVNSLHRITSPLSTLPCLATTLN